MPITPPYSPAEKRALRLQERARKSIEEGRQDGWPRRYVLFGPRVVPVEIHLRAIAKTHQTLQKKNNSLQWALTVVTRKLLKREASLARAAKYIDDLKAGRVQPGRPAQTEARTASKKPTRK